MHPHGLQNAAGRRQDHSANARDVYGYLPDCEQHRRCCDRQYRFACDVPDSLAPDAPATRDLRLSDQLGHELRPCAGLSDRDTAAWLSAIVVRKLPQIVLNATVSPIAKSRGRSNGIATSVTTWP